MDILVNSLIIVISTVYIIDISGFGYTMQKLIFHWLKPNQPYMGQQFKPIGCSLCMSFWLVLIYTLINLTLFQAIIISVLCSYLSIVVRKLWSVLDKYINKIK